MITFEEAKEIAWRTNPEYNEAAEYENAWYIYKNDGNQHIGGDTGRIIFKNDGSSTFPYLYFLGDNYEVVDLNKTINFEPKEKGRPEIKDY